MATASLEHFASAARCPFKRFGMVLGATATALHTARVSRSVAPAARMPASVRRILKNCSQHVLLEQGEVPPLILGSPVWCCLSPLAMFVYGLCWSESLTAVLVVLHDLNAQLVIKAWPAERASHCREQIEAEIDAAKCFACHPAMATMVATCYDEEGNFFSVSPYAGCSLNSIIDHPNWFKTVGAKDRLEFVRLMLLQMMTVFDIMQSTGPRHFYRDVKPDNIVIHPITGLTAVIDYGLKVWSTMENYYDGETRGYWTPEIINPGPFGEFDTYFSPEMRQQATNNTTDTFLASYVALQAAVGLQNLPWRLRYMDHDMSTNLGFEDLMIEHAMAAADGYDELIARVACPVARDFFQQTMCTNPAQRLTPAEALQHPWLASCTAAVQQAVAAATPAYQQVHQRLVDLFAGVPGILVPQQQQQEEEEEEEQPSAACSFSSTASLDIFFDIPYCATPSTCSEDNVITPMSVPTDTSCSSCSSKVATAAADQHPVGTALPGNKSSLLQRGKKLLKQLSWRSSSSSTGANRTGGEGHSTAGTCCTKVIGASTAVVIEVHGWVDDEPVTASVPGLCGLRWLGGCASS